MPDPDDPKPLVIVIGGSPASGKSSLGAWLAGEFRLPFISRDTYKEALMDALGSADAAASHRLGEAAYAIMARLQDQLLEAGVGMVLESNFLRGVSEDDLRPLLPRCRMVAIACETTPEEAIRRFVGRSGGGTRHPGHHDDDPSKLAELEASLRSGCYDPLDLPIPTLELDTTELASLDLAEIAAWVRKEVGNGDDGSVTRTKD